MSTLAEIEAAVDALPRPEQEVLIQHLTQKLHAAPSATPQPSPERLRWLEELDELRARGRTGVSGTPLQEIFDDIRADRC